MCVLPSSKTLHHSEDSPSSQTSLNANIERRDTSYQTSSNPLINLPRTSSTPVFPPCLLSSLVSFFFRSLIYWFNLSISRSEPLTDQYQAFRRNRTGIRLMKTSDHPKPIIKKGEKEYGQRHERKMRLVTV